MRRKDREITDFNEIVEIIRRCDVIRLAMNDGDFPYIVPMNFGMDIVGDQVYFYLHCAREGKKLDLLKKDNRVTFEMDCGHVFIMDDVKMSCTMGYESVMGHGEVTMIEDDESKLKALKILMRQYHEENFPFNEKPIPVTGVFQVKVLDMTAKRRDNSHHKKQA